MSRSRSSGVQFAFSSTWFLCKLEPGRMTAQESPVSVCPGWGSRSALSRCFVVEEGEHCSFSRQKGAGYNAGNCWRWPSTLQNSAILLVLSLLAFWDAYWPWFYSFISTLVSPLLYFLFNPSFLFLFPSLLFFLLLLALPISFPPWSLILPLCSSCSLWV
jgi:hypothetical protein